MKILVIGATGTIGGAVAKAFAGDHEVIQASRKGTPSLDIENPASVRSFFEETKGLDAVVCCAGSARFIDLDKLSDDDFDYGIKSKLMGQVNVVRAAFDSVVDGGSITITSGVLAQHPMRGAAAISLVNAGLEGFMRGAALEAPRGIRVNVVSPGWVKETMVAMGMDPTPGKAAADVARAYVETVQGSRRGDVVST